MPDEAQALDVSVLLEQGAICSLSIGRWRAEDRLVASDIGLEEFKDEAFVHDFLRLGRRNLLPPELQKRLNAAESHARKVLKRYTFATPVGMFCPATAFASLETELAKREAEWFSLRDELVANLAQHEEAVKAAYRNFAKELAERLKRSASQYASRYVAAKIEGRMPTADVIRRSFRFDFNAMRIQVPTALHENVRRQILSEEAAKLEMDTARRKEMEIQRMNQRLHERFEAQRRQMLDGFLEGVAKQVRDTVFEATEAARASLEKNDCLVGKAAQQLRNLVTWCREMNFLENAELTARIDALDAVLRVKPKQRTTEQVQGAIDALHEVVKNELLDMQLGQKPREIHGFEFEELPPSPPLPVLRTQLAAEFGEVDKV